MLKVTTEQIGDLAIVECEGRIVLSDAAFRLRQAVTSQIDARTVVLDLSEVSSIESGGLGMLVYLQHWAKDHDIRLKLFNPRKSVRNRLKEGGYREDFDIPKLDEMMDLLAQADRRYAVAA